MKSTKTIKHTNMLHPNPGLNKEGYNYLQFLCRGCTMMPGRKRQWDGWQASMSFDPVNQACDNSYMTLEEEPGNPYDPDAIQVVCRGEHFGTMGYVGKEYTKQIKEILDKCSAYRVDPVEPEVAGKKEVSLVITWKDVTP